MFSGHYNRHIKILIYVKLTPCSLTNKKEDAIKKERVLK